MATTNIQQWNPTAVGQQNDAAYAADSQRAGGATNPAIFDAQLANKLFYQLSTYLDGLFSAFAAKGFTTSDSNLSTLTATCANFATSADLAPLSTDITNLETTKQDNLGFVPVQQGGGAGQGTNKVYIGWDGSGLRAQVDVTDLGEISFSSNFVATPASGLAVLPGRGISGIYGPFTTPVMINVTIHSDGGPGANSDLWMLAGPNSGSMVLVAGNSVHNGGGYFGVSYILPAGYVYQANNTADGSGHTDTVVGWSEVALTL